MIHTKANYHNAEQKSANDFRYQADIVATNMSHDTIVEARTLTHTCGAWTVDRHDGLGPQKIDGDIYEPDFLVDVLKSNDRTDETVEIDLPYAEKLTILIKAGDQKEYRVTRVYLTNKTTAKSIILMA